MISFNHIADDLRREIEEGAARVISLPNSPIIPDTLSFGIAAEPQPPINVTEIRCEAWHRMVHGHGEDLETALEHFRSNAAFPFPSLMSRMTVAWRRRPSVTWDRDFAAGDSVVRISARYSLILDFPPEAMP